MGRVFLAEETRLRRQVVIKVLPPEMGAGVNVERFEREIELAAGLQHPHIVPLLTAGVAGDLLYYIMPYIRGESLRAKLAREGELPVAEALRILRDVVDALAYAHRNGVVHRDIKPDNVLLAEGHAVVTDFGVAKAVSASSGGSSLTSLGVALGTPAYMAPEQAAADPHVDHRADLYAVGALASQMLSGRTPFLAPTPQALLAAHLTERPEPLTRYRPAVSAALNALVMRCLEKRPADRWQTAAEVAAQLEAMATPTGGLAPAGTGPTVSAGTERAIRRGHPVRVAAVFLAGSVVVLGLVALVMYRLGLPDWVLTAAAILLLIGLPIMIVTGLYERRRAIARAITGTAAGPARAGWFTWRRALWGGGLAFTGLALAATGYTAMRLLGIGPVGTLVASGVLGERERLILAEFENHTGDPTLGPSLTEALRVDLSQSPTVRLVDAAEAGDVLRRMQRPAEGGLSPALAREVAERSGVKAVVTGQVDPLGGGYVLSASLLSAADGRVLTAVRETADTPASLIKAVDRLSRKLRERIGESLVTIRANPPLERVTTGSLAALRRYSEAVRLTDRDRPEEAIPLLEEAIALDSGFAMAYRKLAVAIDNSFGSQSRSIDAATQAFRRRDRLPDVERELATAYYYTNVESDPVKAAAAYRSVLSLDPDNDVALNNLAALLIDERRYAEAESLGTRALRSGAAGVFFFQVVNAQVAQGRLAEARATADRAAETLPPGSGTPPEFRALLALNQRDYSAAERLFQEARERERTSLDWAARLSRSLASTAETRGRLAEAARYRRDYMSVSEARRLPGDYLRGAAALARLELRYRNRPDEAAAIVQAALARYPLDSLAPADRPYLELVQVYLEARKPEQARRLFRQYESSVPEGVRRGVPPGRVVEGKLAEAEGNSARAAELYRDAYAHWGLCGSCGLFELAGLYDRQGAADSARVLYERFVTTPTLIGHLIADPPGLAASYKRLGELYEARSDRVKAAEYYNRFVELWKDADPELQPGVREVRARLARLAGE